ncbi:MAG: T9SS type A sorting domain-containing protein [Bacteroidia bacterium]|nr:T9SS type A sorting domain-containing protein [Bacteroidia bacterium]
MQSIKLISKCIFVSLLCMFFFHFTSSGQTSTLTFTSTNPALGQGGGYTYCTSNGWILKSNSYCGQNVSPAFSSNMNSANIAFLAVNTTSNGRTTVYPMTGGNFVLYTESSGTTPEAMNEIIITTFGYPTYSVDIASVQIYHEAGSNVDFTFYGGTTYRGSELGSTVASVPSGVATTVSLVGSGFYGFNTIRIVPASSIVFGANAFTFSDSELPLTWSYFDVADNKSNVTLSWATFRETNTRHFEIERKLSGEDAFVGIGNVAAAGNSDAVSEYQYNDYPPQSGMVQYRIRQVDNDGHYSFSEIKEIHVNPVISIYPNPTRDQISIYTTDETWSGRLRDLYGKVVMEISSVRSPLDVSTLPAGIYIIEMKNAVNEKVTQKIVKRE